MKKDMTPSEFVAYAADEVQKACAAPGEEQKKPRMEKLAEALSVAKQAFGSVPVPPTISVEVYVDPWEVQTTEQTVQPGQTPTAKADPFADQVAALAKRASDTEEPVRECPWPSDLNSKDFLAGTAPTAHGAWGADASANPKGE